MSLRSRTSTCLHDPPAHRRSTSSRSSSTGSSYRFRAEVIRQSSSLRYIRRDSNDALIGVARIFSGDALFILKKVDDLLSVVALKTPANRHEPLPLSKSPPPTKNVLTLTLALPGVHLQLFRVNYAYRIFSALAGGRCTHSTPWLRLWMR